MSDEWEYVTKWDNFQLPDSVLNQMGAEGWELVSFNKASSQVWSSGWTFKRRKPNPGSQNVAPEPRKPRELVMNEDSNGRIVEPPFMGKGGGVKEILFREVIEE